MAMQDPNFENVMRDAFVMKKQMIKWITIAALGFSLCKFFNFALINLLSDSWAKARARLVL